jgi:hypothetical protein
MKKYKCPCCGFFTFEAKPIGNYDICPVCYWEDDAKAYDEPSIAFRCNGVSLHQARENYLAFGACHTDLVRYVRKPNADEQSGID